jgi:hypothetical protein
MATCLDLKKNFLHSRLLKTWQQTSRTNLSHKFDNLSRIKPNSASLLGISSTTKETLMQQQQQQHLVSTPPSSSLCLPVASTLHISAAFSSTATTPRKKDKKKKKKGVNPCWNWMDFYKPLFLSRNSIPRGEIKTCGKNNSKPSSSRLHRQTL